MEIFLPNYSGPEPRSLPNIMESRHYWCRRIIIYSTQNLPTAPHNYSQIQFLCFENSESSCCFHFCIDFTLKQFFQSMLSQFFTAAVKVEVFSTRLTARSPEFVNCGGEKFCTRHFLLWQGDVKWPLRSASAPTWYHTSYGRPWKLPIFLLTLFPIIQVRPE